MKKNHFMGNNIPHKRTGLFMAIFCFLMLFGKTNNLFAQVVYTCPLISFFVQGEQRGKEAAEKCIMAFHENGNRTVYILKKGATSCDYLDYAYFNNDDNILAKYQFRNRNCDLEPEYTLFTEIIASGVVITNSEYRCKMRESITKHGSLMMFNIYNEGADDIVLSQVVFFRPNPDSKIEFKVEYK